ncbi:hypothetical protein DFP73DRAFT_618431 [Morchella snyderi]|nr:hypothetical protein DFP73DRAFT_618431 [Morchella snyderi]
MANVGPESPETPQTPETAATPPPPGPGRQTSPAAPLPSLTEPLPSLADHRGGLLQLEATVNSAAAKLAEVMGAQAFAKNDPLEKGAEIEGELLKAEFEGIDTEVEGLLAEVEGIWAAVAGSWLEMEQRASEAVRSFREGKRAKDEMEGIGKVLERVVAETERLQEEVDDAVEEARMKEQWKLSDWPTVSRLREQRNIAMAEQSSVSAEVQKAGKRLNEVEQERDRLMLDLERVLSKKLSMETEARISVAETQRLRVEAERLGVEVDRLRDETEWERAPKD